MTETDKHIKEAWSLIVNTRPDEILYTEQALREKIEFSISFPVKKIRTLPQNFIYIGSRALSKLLLCIVVLVLLATSVAAYAIIKTLQLDINEKNTDISVNAERAILKITERYFPQFIPGNFHECDRIVSDTSLTVRYSDGKFDIFYRQELLESKGQIDNENTKEEFVNIAGTEGGLFSEKYGEKTLVFTNRSYLFYIDSNANFISKDDLIQMAESLKKEESEK